MNRPAPRTAARYGLPDTHRIADDLATCGLTDLAEPGTAEVLLGVSRTGRPDLAVTTLARVLTNAGPAEAARLMVAMRNESALRARLLAVIGGSAALGDHLVAHPDQWTLLRAEAAPHDLIDPDRMRRTVFGSVGLDPDAERCTGTAGARATLTGPKAIAALRDAYRSVVLEIAAHDLVAAVDAALPIVALPAVCRSLSDLADATMQAALSMAAVALPRSAPPTRLGIVAMGKCGARELNYVSDVDVIFIADHPAPITPAPISRSTALRTTA